MRFIEALFGFSPDNNTGATEAAILLALAAVLVACGYLAGRRKRRGGTTWR